MLMTKLVKIEQQLRIPCCTSRKSDKPKAAKDDKSQQEKPKKPEANGPNGHGHHAECPITRAYMDLIRAAVWLTQKRKYDVYLSFDPSASAELRQRVRAELKEYSFAEADLQAVEDARHVLVFLSPAFFKAPSCCAELSVAVAKGIECLLVTVAGDTWNGQPFPSLADIPESVKAPQTGKLVRPREAAKAVFSHKLALEFRHAYSPCFMEKLRERLGPPINAAVVESRQRPPGAGWAKLRGVHERQRLRSSASKNVFVKYDAFLSHKRNESQDTVARVHDRMSDAGYRSFLDRNDLVELTGMKIAVRQTGTFVAFLSPSYFLLPACCLEICEAVNCEVPIVLVLVEGSTWGPYRRPFPDLGDVPETISVQDEERLMTLRPRDVMANVFAMSPRLDHTRAYFSSFMDRLSDAVGPPPVVDGLSGMARAVWMAAGGGVVVTWQALRLQLRRAASGSNYAEAEPMIAQALGVRHIDENVIVSAATFASLFPAEASLNSTIEMLARGGGGQQAEERVLYVAVVEAGTDGGGEGEDGGLALVGPSTTLQDVRSQIIEGREDEEDGEAEGENELYRLLAAGQFSFLLQKQRVVRRKQERLVKGKQIGDPVTVRLASAPSRLSAASDAATEEASMTEASLLAIADEQAAGDSAVTAAARGVVAKAARRQADDLDLDTVLRDASSVASIRRHSTQLARKEAAVEAAPQAAAAAEYDASLAQRLLQLNDALAASDTVGAARAAEALRGMRAGGDASVQSPAALAEQLRGEEMRARAALRPALEAMRTEIIRTVTDGGVLRAKTTGQVKGIGGVQDGSAPTFTGAVKRVVVLGGGPCGVAVAHQLAHLYDGFHVTIVDTKEYYEDTPSVLRMMTGDDVDEMWPHMTIPFGEVLRGKGESIVGAVTAVRRDHVLVGTTAGVASRVLPYDYLVISTGTSYQSDIKTEGASVAHRKKSFTAERQRMCDVDSFSVVGSGLVGIELATDLKSYFPDKQVDVFTRSQGWLPRVPGAHAMVNEVCVKLGVQLHVGKEIMHTDEEGRVVTIDGEHLGAKGAKTFWCGGYKPNSDYLADSRTDRGIAEQLDVGGFVKVRRTMQLPGAGLEHIFAGGDITWTAAHSHGERTANMAMLHAGPIVQNILLLAGRREGKLQQVKINAFAGVDILAVSLGTNAGLLYATNPVYEMFFRDKDGIRTKCGEIADAGVGGWQEVQEGKMSEMYSINWLMFSMFPEGVANLITKDDMTVWDQFCAPYIEDVEG